MNYWIKELKEDIDRIIKYAEVSISDCNQLEREYRKNDNEDISYPYLSGAYQSTIENLTGKLKHLQWLLKKHIEEEKYEEEEDENN